MDYNAIELKQLSFHTPPGDATAIALISRSFYIKQHYKHTILIQIQNTEYRHLFVVCLCERKLVFTAGIV